MPFLALCRGYTSLRLFLIFGLPWPAMSEVRVFYNPALHLEPSAPQLGLRYFGSATGQAAFPEATGGPLVTHDAFADDYRNARLFSFKVGLPEAE